MVKFKNEYGSILETNNELLIEQYKKKYTEIKESKESKESKTKKKEEVSK